MWWGQHNSSQSTCIKDGADRVSTSTTFDIQRELHDLDRRIELLAAMQEPVTKSQVPRQLSLKSAPVLAALPIAVDDPISVLDTVPVLPSHEQKKYWSADAEFWNNWKADERKSRQDMLETARSVLEKAKNEAALAAAASEEVARQQREKEAAVSEKEEAKRLSEKAAEVHPKEATQSSVSSIVSADYDNILALGKQFRPQFMEVWKEISLGVSATAGNARSIQVNCSKVGNALRKAATQCGTSRPQVITWLSAFCGSKIVTQACSGNKSLVWSFCYFARTIADLFPDTIRVGVMGELAQSSPNSLVGIPGINRTNVNDGSTKDFELHTRFFLALMITCQDDASLWSWVAASIQALRTTNSYQTSASLWNLMKIYVWMDIGLYDFRRIFGVQSNMLIDILEQTVFPSVDAEVQRLTSTGSSTNVSVQIRFYLDSCYNILQSRKYAQPPEGRMLGSARESELNPDL